MASRNVGKPNLLFILTDDQGAWAMGCSGNPEIRSRNLDRLSAEGTRFENFFCTSPVCSPARASILTGRIPSQHGVHDFLQWEQHIKNCPADETRFLEGQPTYVEMLKEAGYDTCLSGKWHLGYGLEPQSGFQTWKNGIHVMLTPAWTERNYPSRVVDSWPLPIRKMPLPIDSLIYGCPNESESAEKVPIIRAFAFKPP